MDAAAAAPPPPVPPCEDVDDDVVVVDAAAAVDDGTADTGGTDPFFGLPLGLGFGTHRRPNVYVCMWTYVSYL